MGGLVIFQNGPFQRQGGHLVLDGRLRRAQDRDVFLRGIGRIPGGPGLRPAFQPSSSGPATRRSVATSFCRTLSRLRSCWMRFSAERFGIRANHRLEGRRGLWANSCRTNKARTTNAATKPNGRPVRGPGKSGRLAVFGAPGSSGRPWLRDIFPRVAKTLHPPPGVPSGALFFCTGHFGSSVRAVFK